MPEAKNIEYKYLKKSQSVSIKIEFDEHLFRVNFNGNQSITERLI